MLVSFNPAISNIKSRPYQAKQNSQAVVFEKGQPMSVVNPIRRFKMYVVGELHYKNADVPKLLQEAVDLFRKQEPDTPTYNIMRGLVKSLGGDPEALYNSVKI